MAPDLFSEKYDMANDRLRNVTGTIADGQSESAEIDLGRAAKIVTIHAPAGLHANTAKLVFTCASTSGGTFTALWKTGGSARHEEPLNGATGITIAMQDAIKGIRFIKIQTLTAADAAQAQAGGDDFELMVVPDAERIVGGSY